jgi:hypothetical protein
MDRARLEGLCYACPTMDMTAMKRLYGRAHVALVSVSCALGLSAWEHTLAQGRDFWAARTDDLNGGATDNLGVWISLG